MLSPSMNFSSFLSQKCDVVKHLRYGAIICYSFTLKVDIVTRRKITLTQSHNNTRSPRDVPPQEAIVPPEIGYFESKSRTRSSTGEKHLQVVPFSVGPGSARSLQAEFNDVAPKSGVLCARAALGLLPFIQFPGTS